MTSSDKTMWYEGLGNKALRTVFEGALGMNNSIANLPIDRQLEMFVSVAVPVPGLPLLTYSIAGTALPPRGARVLVPLGSRTVTGIVVGESPPADGQSVKPVVDVLDDDAFLPDAVVDLALWVAEYYMAGPGEALAAAMPPKVEARDFIRGPACD